MQRAADGTGQRESRLEPGDVLGRYEVVREIGRGGFGIVWEARDRELGRRVALKVLKVRGEPVREKRLLAEAEVAARLAHPNIVTVLDVGRSAAGAFVIQEFLEGVPLSVRLDQGALPLREAVRICTEIARGLAHAHAAGVVHRDLSPGNVLLGADGQVKILDLGMATALGRKKLDGGTASFMSPEQAAGAPEDERSDVFALGVLLYRMLTGASPFAEDGAALARSSARGLEVKAAPDLALLVESMLEVAPTSRPRDAGLVLRSLEEISARLPPKSTEPDAVRIRRSPRRRWFAAGATAGVLLAALLAAPLLWRSFKLREPKLGELLLVGASAASTPCSLGMFYWHSLAQPLPDGSALHGGKLGDQGFGVAGGRPAWVMRSDWSNLFVPLPDFGSMPVFGVEVEFFLPEVTTFPRGVRLVAFTDPRSDQAGDANNDHGCGVAISVEPGRAPSFNFTDTADEHGAHNLPWGYRGLLAANPTGAWHVLRVEGARDGSWFRAVLDGTALFTGVGRCDLAGHHVALTAGYGFLHPEDVALANLRLYQGAADCR